MSAEELLIDTRSYSGNQIFKRAKPQSSSPFKFCEPTNSEYIAFLKRAIKDDKEFTKIGFSKRKEVARRLTKTYVQGFAFDYANVSIYDASRFSGINVFKLLLNYETVGGSKFELLTDIDSPVYIYGGIVYSKENLNALRKIDIDLMVERDLENKTVNSEKEFLRLLRKNASIYGIKDETLN